MQNDAKNTRLEIGERSRRFALAIITFIEGLDKKDWMVQVLGRQLLRSGTSVGANIVEARAGSSRKDFTNFYSYALKSANETKFWLGLFKDSNKASVLQAQTLVNEATELANILGSSIIKLKGKEPV